MMALISRLGLPRLLLSRWYIAVILALVAFGYVQDHKLSGYKNDLAVARARIEELTDMKDVLTGSLLRSNEEVAQESKRLIELREESAMLKGMLQELRYNNREAVKTIMNAPTPKSAEEAMQLLRESIVLIEFNR